MRARNIVVVGAGPVGTIAALACARAGHQVTLLEAEERIDDSPRASTTQPPTLEILAELGLIDEYMAQGLVARTFQFWDRPTLTLVAEFDFERLRGRTAYPYVVQTEQHKLVRMGLERLRRMDNASVVLGARVTGLSQDDSQAQAVTADAVYKSDYVIGCDGGRSTVRKCLGIEFEGFTNLFKVAGDDLKGRWRAVFNTREDESDEEALSDDSVGARLARVYVPERERRALHLNLYNVHQRVAKHFREGRVFLCGDAAHVNNPIGGLGLNSGIHEAWHLANLLAADGADLDDYERRRRPLNIEYVQQQTIANKRRLEERDPASRAARFAELRAMADDPKRHAAFLMRASLLETWRAGN
jgi:3-(3-hydroxy-phenyl)propionate hydroxylase